MKLLDRYILQTFFVSLLIVGISMVGLTLVLVVFFNMDEFLDTRGSQQALGFWTILWNIGDYYFYKFFEFFKMLAGLWLLTAAAATLARFNRNQELATVKAAGISMYRVLWPLIVTALVVDGLYIVNQEIIVPHFAVEIARSPNDLAGESLTRVEFIRDDRNNILFAPVYDPEKKEMRASTKAIEGDTVKVLARVRIFLRDSSYNALGTIEADRANWDAARGGWVLVGGRQYKAAEALPLLDRAPEQAEGAPVDFYATNVGPETIQRYRANDFYKYLSYRELQELARDPLHNRRGLQVVMHRHVTDPIMLILTLLLGLPFVAGREEQSYLASISIAFILQIGVMILAFAFMAFGDTGHISPLWAAWVPPFVVLPASILAMESLRT